MDGCVVMTALDQKRYSWVLDVIEGRLSLGELSLLTLKSYRQCQRTVAAVKKNGMKGTQHGNAGRTPANKSCQILRQDVMRLMKEKYFDFNLSHFAEKLLICEGIPVKRETLRVWAHAVGSPKKARRRRSKKIHQLRPRMPRAGMLVQFDGSDHDWFSGSGPRAVLIGGIDDATGEVLHIEFFPAEDTWSCLKVIREITDKYGVADAYYLDQAGHFGKINSEQDTTQVGRALKELGMKAILATTPQAKGRVERLWGTLQDRLVAELRLHGINRIPRANEFIKNEFLPAYNAQFSVVPRNLSYLPRKAGMMSYQAVKEYLVAIVERYGKDHWGIRTELLLSIFFSQPASEGNQSLSSRSEIRLERHPLVQDLPPSPLRRER